MDEIERLLRNWGRWAYDDHRTRKGVSNIQIVLNRLKLYGEKGSSSDDDRAAPTAIRTQIDEAEAMRIDKTRRYAPYPQSALTIRKRLGFCRWSISRGG